MTISQIRYFIEVSEQMSFTKAAVNLFVTQQLVSKQVKRLEEELGYPLFERKFGHLSLTEAGVILFDFWKQMLKDQEKALVKAKQAAQGESPTVRVGTIPISSLYDRISDAITAVSAQSGDKKFSINSDSYIGLYKKLMADELDCIISLADENTGLSDEFEEQAFMEIWPSLVISRYHPLCREDLTVRDLTDTTFYILSENFSWKAEHNVLKYCSMCGVMPKHIEYFDDVNSLEMALYAGRGVSLIYAELFRNPSNHLMVIPLEQNPMRISNYFSVAYRKNKKGQLDAFIKELLKNG